MLDRTDVREGDVLDFNFWPSFADLMLALVLVLVLVVFIVNAVIAVGTVNLKHVQDNQTQMVRAIAAQYGVEPEVRSDSLFAIPIQLPDGKSSEVLIQNEPTLQRLSFKDRILFLSDNYQLNSVGRETLAIVGREIKNQLTFIREIQIQGHADPDPTYLFSSNLHLAARRAIEVFNFLQHDIGIDPAEHLMSATSFGEFKPVQRSEEGSHYNLERLHEHNKSEALKAQNRRIEILLFYRL